MEIEYRPIKGIDTMTSEEKKEILKRMLASAGLTENDIEVQKVDILEGKELEKYYNQYDKLINKYKAKKL